MNLLAACTVARELDSRQKRLLAQRLRFNQFREDLSESMLGKTLLWLLILPIRPRVWQKYYKQDVLSAPDVCMLCLDAGATEILAKGLSWVALPRNTLTT